MCTYSKDEQANIKEITEWEPQENKEEGQI